MKSKQGNCVSSAAMVGGTGEKEIPKERLVLATDSDVTSGIKRNEFPGEKQQGRG